MKSTFSPLILGLLTLLTLCILGQLPHSFADESSSAPAPAPKPDAEAASAEASGSPLTTTIRSLTGSVMARSTDSDPWLELQPGQTLPVGAQLRTGLRGNVVLDIGPNATLTVGPLTLMSIGQLQHDPNSNTIHTLVAVTHGRVNFQVNHVGFDNDFRIASPTDVVAVKGTIGSFSAFDGPADITGNHSNGNDAIRNRTNTSDTDANLTGGQSIYGNDRTPEQRAANSTWAGNQLGGMGDYSDGNADGRHGPAGGFDPAGLINQRDYQQVLYGSDPNWRDIPGQTPDDNIPDQNEGPSQGHGGYYTGD